MLAESQSELILGHWWQLAAATVAMAVFVTAFSLMADAWRDALDPKLRGLRMTAAPLLKVEDLQRRVPPARRRRPRAPRRGRGRGDQGVSFEVPANTTVALVGESGSGKSVTAMALVQLLPRNAECAGRVLWRGDDLLQAPRAHMQRLRGHEIACVFQDPMSLAEPGADDRRADRRAAAQAPAA